jgi:spermidine synthase
MLDAFNGEYIPEHLMTREFLEEVRSLMHDGSVLAANTFSISDLYEYESATYAAVFGTFFNMKPDDSGNRVISTATAAARRRDPGRARRALREPLAPFGVDLERFLPLMTTDVDWNPNAAVLTDQYAPANLLRNR